MASYKIFSQHSDRNGNKSTAVRTFELGRWFEFPHWGLTETRVINRRPRKRSGRRFNKFERELISTFERTQGREACRLAIAVIRGEIEPWDVAEKVPADQPWIKVPSGAPRSSRLHDAKMEILDCLLGTHGTEYLLGPDCGVYCAESCSGYDPSYSGPEIEYLNAGDTYAGTLCYVHGRRYPWTIACWGDFAERYCRHSAE